MAYQFLHVFVGSLGVDHQQKWQIAATRNGRGVFYRVVRHVLHQERDGRVRRVGRDEQRVPVRLGARDILRGNGRVGAGLVFHHHLLAQNVAQFGGKNAAHGVGARACRKRHHQADRFVRVGRRRGAGRREGRGGQGGGRTRSGGRRAAAPDADGGVV